MSFIQEAYDIDAGKNFVPVSVRFRLNDHTDSATSVILLSNAFEYDMELIKNFPKPISSYKTIIIPYHNAVRILGKSFSYSIDKAALMANAAYAKEMKTYPPMRIRTTRVPVDMKENMFISASDIMKKFTEFFHTINPEFIRDNIDQILFGFIQDLCRTDKTKDKIIVIDTTRFRLCQHVSSDTYNVDVVNAFLTALVLDSERMKKIPSNGLKMIFRAPNCDYMFNYDLFNPVRDVPRLQAMLRSVGKIEYTAPATNEEVESIEASMFDESSKALTGDPNPEQADQDNDIMDEVIGMDNTDLTQEDIKHYQFASKSPITSIKSTINTIKSMMNVKQQQTPSIQQDNSDAKLRNAKQFKINATLVSRIIPASGLIDNYKTIADDLKPIGNNPVENNIIDSAAKELSRSMKPINVKNSINTVSSPREQKIRSIVGKIELDTANIDKITSVVDAPLAVRSIPNGTSTTNAGAMQGTSFVNIAKEYEDKLLDRDIVSTFMKLGDLPYGFTIKDVEVTDISTVTTLMNNWKIILDNKKSGRRSTLNIRVPRLVNGRFYNNGIWYNIGKQDFPIPILKTNPKTVMITSNYNKMEVSRYDTKSLVDITAFAKVVKTLDDPATGVNPYVKPGSSVATNSRYPSTVEFDEYAKMWLSFNNKHTDCKILFNRNQCARAFEFVSVKDDEFCCGMINQVPIVININTGLSREGKSLTDIMISTLPSELHNKYVASKPGKVSMYAQLRVLATNMPAGVVCCAWEGITTVLEKAKTEHQFVDKSFKDTSYFMIPFKDKILAIKNTIQNQLLFNGFYKVSTKNHMYAEFDETIIEANSIYVDIFNDLFFKKFSDLTAFITTYHFFVDVITEDVCNHYKIPNDIVSMIIYATNLLADNSRMNEHGASLYRVRSSEILPAIIHYHLAMAISKYNNTIGSKTRTNTLVMNPNEIMNELLEVNTVSPMSALNPMIELHARETVTNKGFMGLNVERSYTKERRSYNDTMIGKVAISSPNSANVGINRQLVCDPKLESVRGYTSSEITADSDLNDLQLASFSELLTPGCTSRDDAIRTAIATSQTGHIVSTENAQPVLIANGVDEIVPAYLTDEFSYVAKEDGKVLEMSDDYMIIQYKSGKKEAVNIGSKYSFNSGSGFYVDNKLLTNVKANDSFHKNDILAYHEKHFSKDVDGVVRMNLGPLAKVAFTGSYFTYEDAGLITKKMSERLGTKLTMMESVKIDATDDIDSIVKVGDEIEIGDPLVVFGLGDTGDKAVDTFLKAFQTDSLDTAKRKIVAKHAGKVVDVRIYTNKSMDKLSPSLFKIISEHFKENKKKRAMLDKHDPSNDPYKLNTLYSRPTEPLKGNTIKGITCDVFVEIYLEHSDNVSIGDKIVLYGPNKQIISDYCPEGLEPYAESRPEEEISIVGAPVTVLKRMIPSVAITAAGNKVLIEMKRKIKDIWERK